MSQRQWRRRLLRRLLLLRRRLVLLLKRLALRQLRLILSVPMLDRPGRVRLRMAEEVVVRRIVRVTVRMRVRASRARTVTRSQLALETLGQSAAPSSEAPYTCDMTACRSSIVGVCELELVCRPWSCYGGGM
jgi:hypothetical protein